jgi:outer membrane lipoprotein-sorting protein
MSKKIFFLISIASILSIVGIKSATAQNNEAKAVILQMIDSTQALKGFKSIIRKTERIEGELVLQVSKVKVSSSPYEIYVRQLSPKSGVEILCANGCKKAIINLNGFPWINITLDPYGMRMRRHQHHTVHDSGFDLLASILERNLQEFNPAEQTLIRKDDVFYSGEDAIKIEMVNNAYETKPYKVIDDENIADIAKKFNVNEYAILELNSECGNYEDVRSGQVIIIPSHYGVKMILYISKKTSLPLIIRVYDYKGLFEEYDYTHFQANPQFATNEFDEDFAEYNF